MSDEKSFQELLSRVQAGDEAAAAELVRRYEPAIRRVARLRLADTRLQRLFDSMDICQSVFGSFFVRAALGQYQLETPDELLKLLVTMSKRKVADQARRAGAARRDFRRDAEQDIPPDKLDTADSPSVQVSGRELLEEFRKRLSEEERHLADKRAAGLDWSQIAAEQGGSAEALRKQLTRAIDRISEQLGLDSAS